LAWDRWPQTAETPKGGESDQFSELIYGLSAFGLAQQLGIEQKEAAQFIKRVFHEVSRG